MDGEQMGRRQVGQRRGSWEGKRGSSGRPSEEQRVSNKDIRGKAMGRHIRRGRRGERVKSGGTCQVKVIEEAEKRNRWGEGEGQRGGERHAAGVGK